jgi:alkylation response protein AidB-like acyl-CoA dehydrogenase
MEMTIARDRWQQHLKTKGQHYHDVAATLEELHGSHPSVGADVAALAHHALAEVFEWARAGHLTRNQHVLFRLGELAAHTEGAAALARWAARASDGALPEKTGNRFSPEALAAMARVFAREAALKTATDGMRWVRGGGGVGDTDLERLERAVGLAAVYRSQGGLLDDLDEVADALYGRQSTGVPS